MSDQQLFAPRTRGMGANAIREILKVTSQPGMRSLAGGIPAPEVFPMEAIARLSAEAIERWGSATVQYGLTEGFGPLREQLVGYLANKGVSTSAEEVTITSGSQGALAALGMVLIGDGAPVAVEAPTYLGAISAFNPYQPKYVAIETDDEGVIPESLEEIARRDHPVFVYLTPTFQNPTGRTIPLERRRRIAEIARRDNLLVIEDDPYGDLRYTGEPIPTLKSLAPDHVVYLGTVSKVFAPGLRVGFAVAPTAVRRWIVTAKQGIDLHTSSLSQALTALYLESGELERRLPRILECYRPRRRAMLDAIAEYFPPQMRTNEPDGGMFVWSEGPARLDTVAMYDRAVARNVAYVPGRFFYPPSPATASTTHPAPGAATMRLNFTMVDEETITDAIRTLGEVLDAELNR